MAFPRISDDLGFHVRPHALSSQDTIIFTNGKEITKRSFWANKNIIQDIINSKSQYSIYCYYRYRCLILKYK